MDKDNFKVTELKYIRIDKKKLVINNTNNKLFIFFLWKNYN